MSVVDQYVNVKFNADISVNTYGKVNEYVNVKFNVNIYGKVNGKHENISIHL